jgi:hypothetical protein
MRCSTYLGVHCRLRRHMGSGVLDSGVRNLPAIHPSKRCFHWSFFKLGEQLCNCILYSPNVFCMGLGNLYIFRCLSLRRNFLDLLFPPRNKKCDTGRNGQGIQEPYRRSRCRIAPASTAGCWSNSATGRNWSQWGR